MQFVREGASVCDLNIFQEMGTWHCASNAVNDLLEAYWSMESVIKYRVHLASFRFPQCRYPHVRELLEEIMLEKAWFSRSPWDVALVCGKRSLEVHVKRSSAIKGAQILVSAGDTHIRDVHSWSDKPHSVQPDGWDRLDHTSLVSAKLLQQWFEGRKIQIFSTSANGR